MSTPATAAFAEYRLPPAFLRTYADKPPPFGPVGLPTYLRTYARELEDGTRERWDGTAQRVVEGQFGYLQGRVDAIGGPWPESKMLTVATDSYDRLFDQKWMPGGRGLQFMGTHALRVKGAGVVNNCGFFSTASLAQDFAGPFCRMMDFLMLGVGVGFDDRGAGTVIPCAPRMGGTFRVEDTREGWVAALKAVLDAFDPNTRSPLPAVFDFIDIRPAGAPLKTFGGTSSGPGLLDNLLRAAEGFLRENVGRPITVTTIGDLMNVIGRCVVAGGIRRSSQIYLGAPTTEFLGLKDPSELNRLKNEQDQILRDDPDWQVLEAERVIYRQFQRGLSPLSARYMELQQQADRVAARQGELAQGNAEWARLAALIDRTPLRDRRWASNNSIFARVGMNYDAIAEQIITNGEPGLFWLDDVVRAYGRRGDPMDTKDSGVCGVNPCAEQPLFDGELCLAQGTRILTSRGYQPVEALLGVENLQVAVRFRGDEVLEEADRFEAATVFPTGVKATLCLTTVDGRKLTLTPLHPVLAHREGEEGPRWIPAGELEIGDALVAGAVALTEATPRLDPTYYALGHFAGDGWLLNTGGRHAVGVCAGPSERPLLERLLPVWEGLIARAAPYRESNYDDRYNVPLRITTNPGGVHSFSVTKPQVYRMLLDEFGFAPGTAPSKRFPACYWSAGVDEKRSFLRGLFDADGSVPKGPRRAITLTAANEAFARDALLALGEFGIEARLTTHALPERAADRSQTILMVRGADNLAKFAQHIFFSCAAWPSSKGEALTERLAAVKVSVPGSRACVLRSIDPGPEVSVYNLEVPGARHYVAEGLVVHNCNLVETVLPRHRDLNDWLDTLEVAFLYGKTVSLIPVHDPVVEAVMAKNRRIGLSVTGVGEMYDRIGPAELTRWFDAGYAKLRELDAKYSAWLDVPESIRRTSVKPSGTVSLLPGVQGGMRFPESMHYMRLIRFSSFDPLVPKIQASGYRVEPDCYAPQTVVAYFPVAERGFKRTVYEVPLAEQMELQRLLQGRWADNSVSATLMFQAHERGQIAPLLRTHEGHLKAASFLPLADRDEPPPYVQMPYTACTEEEYLHAASRITLPLAVDAVDGGFEAERFCDGGVCSIPVR